MKIDRLIGILAVLLQREKVTAPYLAEKFEVSRRTINRDIEDICRAGIPIVTRQGQNGGISIMEGYRIERTLLTSSDMQSILAGLRSLDSVSGTSRYRQLMEKLSAGNTGILTSNNHILIDLSSWYKNELAPKIELIQAAIERCEKIGFTYYAPKGESSRKIEPYLLIFRWSAWYVWGYCCTKKDYRMFKLNRMVALSNTGEEYKRRTSVRPDFSAQDIWEMRLQATILVDEDMRWRLIEEYGPESYTEAGNGKLLFQAGFSDRESLFSWLLGFREKAELKEPQEMRQEFAQLLQEMGAKYKAGEKEG